MKILHLATQDKAGGGGGFDAAYRLHRSMRSSGLNSYMMVLDKVSNDPDVVDVGSQLSIYEQLKRLIFKINGIYLNKIYKSSSYFYFEPKTLISASRLVGMMPFKPDVIVAHWIAGFVSVVTLRELYNKIGSPIIWYFMDIAPMTGGCHYSLGCMGFTDQCGNCQQLGIGRRKYDLSYRQWKRKWSSFQQMNITALAASSWVLDQIKICSLFQNKRHEIILLGVNADIFCPKDPCLARKIHKLPNERKIIFFGAQHINEKRKGIQYLVDSLSLLHDILATNVSLRERILIVTASRDLNSNQFNIPFEHLHIGFLKGDDMLAAAYQAADVFVNASIEDAGPMMINESLLCGTPVVTFDMGVAEDLVHTGITGYKAILKSSQDMACGLYEILKMDEDSYRSMRKTCREMGLQKCHPEVQMRAFEKLFHELISDI